jgi:hypothetical protein
MSLPTTAPYLTVIRGRTPQNKPHLSLGEAKKAVVFRLWGEVLEVPCLVYRWVDNKGWELIWKVEAGTHRKAMPWNTHP